MWPKCFYLYFNLCALRSRIQGSHRVRDSGIMRDFHKCPSRPGILLIFAQFSLKSGKGPYLPLKSAKYFWSKHGICRRSFQHRKYVRGYTFSWHKTPKNRPKQIFFLTFVSLFAILYILLYWSLRVHSVWFVWHWPAGTRHYSLEGVYAFPENS